MAPLLALIDDSGNLIENDTVRLTEAQARGILDLRLARLTGLERDKIQAELTEVAGAITELLRDPGQPAAPARGDPRRAAGGAATRSPVAAA